MEPPAPPAPPSLPPGYIAAVNGYYQLKSGSCGAAAMITDVDECNEAAEALGLSDTSASTSSATYYPPGCVLRSSSLYLYPATNSYACASYEQCICSLKPPSPPPNLAAPPSVPPMPPGYVAADGAYYQLESGSCGGAVIEDKASCDAAAEALGLSDTTAYESTSTSYPPGCVLSYGSLYLYPATNSYSCRSSEQCLCALRPPSPPAPPASAAGATDARPGAVAQTGSYYLITSGSCGGAVIEDKATCDAAAAALGLSDTSASTSSATYYAPGCVRYSSLYLYPATNSPTSNPCSSTSSASAPTVHRRRRRRRWSRRRRRRRRRSRRATSLR